MKRLFPRRYHSRSRLTPQVRSLCLAMLFFLGSTAISPVVANITSSKLMVQIQQNAPQLGKKARELYRSGQFEKAAIVWKDTAAAYAAQQDSLNQAMALSNLSLTYQKLGKWESAKNAIADSLKILKTQPQKQEQLRILANSLDIQGYLQREIGQSADALQTWQESTKIYSQIKNSSQVTQSKINQAQAMQDLGFYPRACNTVLEALKTQLQLENCQELGRLTSEELTTKLQQIETSSPPITVVLGLTSLGNILQSVGQLEQSKMVLETSLKVVQKLNYPQQEAAVYLALGNTAQALAESETIRRQRQNYQQTALDSYSHVIKLSTSPTTRQQAKLNQLSLLLKRKKTLEASQLWQDIKSQFNSLPPSRTTVYLQINFAQSLVKLAQTENFNLTGNSQLPSFNEIDSILVQALAQARSFEDKAAQAYALGFRGRLYELSSSRQNLSQAEQLTKQALSLASNLESPHIAYQFFWQLGRIRKAQNDIPDAIAAYTKAYDSLQSLRGDLVAVNPEVQFAFRDNVEPIYRQLVQLDLEYARFLKTAGKEKESHKLLTQARNVIESLQLAEINNFFREACVDAKPQQIDQIDKNAAVIYPIILKDRLEILLSLPNQPPQLYSTKISQSELENTVGEVQGSLLKPISREKYFLPKYQKLYNWLIRPVEKQLANSKVKTVAFVLDGDLRNIPMAVLHDGKQYLLEKYAIALTPGLQLVNPKPLTAINFKALTAGLSEIRKDLPAHQGFNPLPNVPSELEQIQKIGLSGQPLLNKKFTTNTVQQEISDFRFPIVHLATHAKFSSKAEDTFILSWDRRINVKQLDNLLRDKTLNQPRAIELLVLSACETASGDKRATLGLAGVAVRAGARSTLATLWPVADESTAKIMSEFYRQLGEAKTTQNNKAQVLQQAQLTLLTDEKYNHPHFWAPYVLVGNWQ